MANNCFNYIQVFGSERGVNMIYENLIKGRYDNDISLLGLGDYNSGSTSFDFSAESKWSPPRELVQMFSADYKCLVECEYDEFGSDIGGKFAYDKGKLVYNIEMTYLESKYHSLDWNEFLECEVMWRLEDPEPFDEFIEPFKEFCSDGEIIELEELFFEHSN